MTAAAERPSPVIPASNPGERGAHATGLGPHSHPIRDITLPHQIILSRYGLDQTTVTCNCLSRSPVPLMIGIGPADDPAKLLAIYQQHLVET